MRTIGTGHFEARKMLQKKKRAAGAFGRGGGNGENNLLYVVTGGSGSGKSEYAEKILSETGGSPMIYLATMRVLDEDGKKRVERHRAMRENKGFITVERFTALSRLRLPERGENTAVLLECMSNLLANEYERVGASAGETIIKGIKHLQKQCGHLIIVTNEVFSDGGVYKGDTRKYLEIFGAVNRELGRMADSLTEVVYGIPIKIK